MWPDDLYSAEDHVKWNTIPSGSFIVWKQALKEMRFQHMQMSFNEACSSFACPLEARKLNCASRSEILCTLNNLAPIHRLPTELLIKIFQYVPTRILFRDTVAWKSKILRQEDIVRLVLVCHRWKDVIYNAGTLWCTINNITYNPMRLELAQGTKLRCMWQTTPSNRNTSAFRRMLAENIERVQELHIIDTGCRRVSISINEKLSEAPRLEVLSVVGSINEPQFFESPLPRLRTLFLCRTPGIPIHPLPRLTQLSLCYVDRIDISDLLALLADTPALQDLHLISCMKSSDKVVLHASIPLKRLLRVLIMDSRPGVVNALLDPLLFQASTAVRIEYTDWIDLRPVDMSFTHSLSPIVDQTCNFAITTGAHSLRLFAASSTSGISVAFNGRGDSEAPPDPIPLGLLPGVQLREVFLLGRWRAPPGTLRSLPDSLELIYTSVSFLVDLTEELGVHDQTQHVPCPNLSTLHVLIDRGGQRLNALPLSKIAPAILKFAQRRSELGHPVEDVIIGFYNHEPEDKLTLSGITNLRRAVERVEVTTHSEPPFINLPPICTAADGRWWPSWTDSITDISQASYRVPASWMPSRTATAVPVVEMNDDSDNSGSGSDSDSDHMEVD
ncbi:hypothetical protein CERSUDRAFT_124725 [Gelatoporia subvermispora B]|uniref:F-box domain-containing protein n=1 Tax=Ceriporiopsis subvermispora (strain B) TaxID=914234 RepID=M2PH88_CERS8|nr:hypothetical protein CERSUDRAFT_124725 [Gelatoporia subvermispora B]